MIVQIVLIIPVVSKLRKSGQSYGNTTRRFQMTWMTEMDLVTWIELSSLQTIGVIM